MVSFFFNDDNNKTDLSYCQRSNTEITNENKIAQTKKINKINCYYYLNRKRNVILFKIHTTTITVPEINIFLVTDFYRFLPHIYTE